MNEERRIAAEEVDKVETPPRARVESASQTLDRKRDYLAGFLAGETRPKELPDSGSDALKADVIAALKSVYDPEIPVDIYELGLIYDVAISEDGDALVTMTLTTPHCPVAETLPQEVELRVLSVPGIRDGEVRLVWDPPWDPSKMSDEARSRIGNAMNEQSTLRARPAAILLTPAAEARIAELMERAPDGAIGVKLSTPRRGCSGLAYSVDYVTEEVAFDEKIVTPGGTFYVDGASILYLVGSTMDWKEDDFAAGFVFDNPNATGACGCGESFTV